MVINMKKLIALICAGLTLAMLTSCVKKDEVNKDAVTIEIRCECEDIYQIYYTTYLGKESYGIGAVADIDGKKLTIDVPQQTVLTREYLKNGDVSKLVMDFSPYGKDDKSEQGTTNKLEIPAEYGKTYTVHISGDKQNGFKAVLAHSEVVK